MLKMTITITATTEEELGYAIDEVKRKLDKGNLSGFDSREDGITAYDFETEGDESPYIECKSCGSNVYYEGKKPTSCDNCGEEL